MVTETLVRMDVRMPESLRQRARVCAARAGLGIAEWVRRAVEQAAEREEA
jgi:predicted HicB family RNase H-like nuclease